MEVKKIMSIINRKNKVIGFIQKETYDDLIIFTINTKSIGDRKSTRLNSSH